ncbi:MAG: antibiotic biosynthesis monooxygenase [Proteobacteria bacterium]|nr:antibiotic biosynthesis monooxygenase [Pseudomonadota bacterium]
MILEVAILNVKPGLAEDFELAFGQAQKIITAMPGYLNHQLQRCIEDSDRYLLMVNWESLEAHTQGFRQSESYQGWRRLLHHFYDPFPVVEHYQALTLPDL